MEFSREVAWVTGSSTGIGRAVAEALARQGRRVVVHYNASEDEAREVARGISSSGGEAMLVGGDVSDSDEVDRMVGEIEDRYGHPEDDAMIGRIQFRVIDAWKGVSGESVVLYGQEAAYYGELEEGEMAVSGGCAYVFGEGESYLVYASRYDDGLQTGICDRTASLAEAEKDLDVLGPPADRLTETGGPPLPFAGVLAAVAALWVSCAVLVRP